MYKYLLQGYILKGGQKEEIQLFVSDWKCQELFQKSITELMLKFKILNIYLIIIVIII